MIVSVIAARAENDIIGRGNALPWHLPRDLQRFKALTTGHTIIMGRRTWESIGRPLPNRRSIVVTSDPAYRAEGIEVAHSLDEALVRCTDEEEVFVIGGTALFEAALPVAQRLYLTTVHGRPDGDATFPPFDAAGWSEIEREEHPVDEHHAYAHTFSLLVRH